MTKIKISPLAVVFAVLMIFLRRGYSLVVYTVAVVMHEMAHAEVARRRGYALDNVKIMPYGAALTGEFEGVNSRDEFLIAAAGPLSNVFLAVLFTAVWWVAPVTYFFTEDFVVANIFTALTNFLPVFPLDGGRIVLAVMSRKVPRQRAYKILRILGFVICGAFFALFVCSVFVGVNFSFALMALFILLSTVFPDKQSKYQRLYNLAYRSDKLKRGLAVREIMVSAECTLGQLSKMLNGNYYVRFNVADERMRVCRTFTETELENLLTVYPLSVVLSELPESAFYV